MVLAVSGGKDGSVGTIEARDLEKDCETPTPSATADEFCSRYRDYVAWARSNGSDDITKPLAGEIANRFIDMEPYAPAELAGHVALMIRVYGTYASAPPYIDLPMVGPDAAHIPEALTAMSNYCHVSLPIVSNMRRTLATLAVSALVAACGGRGTGLGIPTPPAGWERATWDWSHAASGRSRRLCPADGRRVQSCDGRKSRQPRAQHVDACLPQRLRR